MYVPDWVIGLFVMVLFLSAVVDGYTTLRVKKLIKKQHAYASEGWGALLVLVNAVNQHNPEIFEDPVVEKMIIDLRAKNLLEEAGLE